VGCCFQVVEGTDLLKATDSPQRAPRTRRWATWANQPLALKLPQYPRRCHGFAFLGSFALFASFAVNAFLADCW